SSCSSERFSKLLGAVWGWPSRNTFLKKRFKKPMVGISARRKREANVDANLACDSDGAAGGKLLAEEFGRSKTFRGARMLWRKPGARENETGWRDSAGRLDARIGITVATRPAPSGPMRWLPRSHRPRMFK